MLKNVFRVAGISAERARFTLGIRCARASDSSNHGYGWLKVVHPLPKASIIQDSAELSTTTTTTTMMIDDDDDHGDKGDKEEDSTDINDNLQRHLGTENQNSPSDFTKRALPR